MSDAIPTIAELIPHEAPMILIDRIVELSPKMIDALSHWPHPDAEGLSGAVWTLEIAAQACAAHIGYYQRERGFREGRLIKSQHWNMFATAIPDSTLQIKGYLEAASDVGVFLFNVTVNANDDQLAEGQLTILAR